MAPAFKGCLQKIFQHEWRWGLYFVEFEWERQKNRETISMLDRGHIGVYLGKKERKGEVHIKKSIEREYNILYF